MDSQPHPQEVELTPELIAKILGWVENETANLYWSDRRQSPILYTIA